MTRTMKRMAPICGTTALLALVFAFHGCAADNMGNTGTGGAPATGTGGTSTTGTGGTTTTGAGGTTTAGTGGTSTGAAGATTSTGGTTGAAGQSGTFGSPACGNTMAGAAAGKGVACTADDVQLCYKTCGPEKSGVKSETCTNGAYAEGSCMFDQTENFMCYAIPATPDPTCPTTAPMASSACAIADCVVCGGTTGYLDSSGASKTGYCVCQASSSNPTWSCASSTAWPCPSGSGC
jgi:hypothetical protein